jgi:hypothetical protein
VTDGNTPAVKTFEAMCVCMCVCVCVCVRNPTESQVIYPPCVPSHGATRHGGAEPFGSCTPSVSDHTNVTEAQPAAAYLAQGTNLDRRVTADTEKRRHT